jgi:hypothetical protein
MYQQAKYSILHKLKTPKGAHIQAVFGFSF